jgi:hypothetical protein
VCHHDPVAWHGADLCVFDMQRIVKKLLICSMHLSLFLTFDISQSFCDLFAVRSISALTVLCDPRPIIDAEFLTLQRCHDPEGIKRKAMNLRLNVLRASTFERHSNVDRTGCSVDPQTLPACSSTTCLVHVLPVIPLLLVCGKPWTGVESAQIET